MIFRRSRSVRSVSAIVRRLIATDSRFNSLNTSSTWTASVLSCRITFDNVDTLTNSSSSDTDDTVFVMPGPRLTFRGSTDLLISGISMTQSITTFTSATQLSYNHRRRLHGDDHPMAKKLWGDTPKSPHQSYARSIFETEK